MLITYPIGLAFLTFGADATIWWTGDELWPRAAVWTAGIGFIMGVIAGISGTVELLIVPGIRAPSWTHFILACTLLSILGVNWGYRLFDPEQARAARGHPNLGLGDADDHDHPAGTAASWSSTIRSGRSRIMAADSAVPE